VDLDPSLMSPSHKCALAKLPDAIEWLLTALGAPEG
jgi:hypothetical protein